jgi:hypothetical protein
MRLARVAVFAIALGCSGRSTPAGQEKGYCYSNGTCNPGLSCFSNRCVRYDGGAADAPADGGSAAGGGGAGPGAAGQIGGPGGAGGGGTSGIGDAGDGREASAEAGTPGTAGASPNDGGGSTDVVDATGADGGLAPCDGGLDATPKSEMFSVLACGMTPATTSGAYAGLVTMTVSGLFTNSPGQPLEDAFYHVDLADNSKSTLGACPECFRYNRLSEGACVCYQQCPSYRVSDLVVGGYPAFSPTHVYTVTLDLGTAPAEQIDFGMADCGCYDNAGTHDVTLTPVNTCTP